MEDVKIMRNLLSISKINFCVIFIFICSTALCFCDILDKNVLQNDYLYTFEQGSDAELAKQKQNIFAPRKNEKKKLFDFAIANILKRHKRSTSIDLECQKQEGMFQERVKNNKDAFSKQVGRA